MTKLTLEDCHLLIKEKFNNNEVINPLLDLIRPSFICDNGEFLYTNEQEKDSCYDFIISCYKNGVSHHVLYSFFIELIDTFYRTNMEIIAEEMVDRLTLLRRL